jgi:exodeoxyribonuclease VII large subunit
MVQKLERKREQLVMMQEAFKRHGVEQRLANQKEQLDDLKERFNRQILMIFEQKSRDIIPLKERLNQNIDSSIRQKKSLVSQMMQGYEAQHPKHKNKRGFAQITREGKVIDLDVLNVGDQFEAMNDKRVVRAEVVEITTLSV